MDYRIKVRYYKLGKQLAGEVTVILPCMGEFLHPLFVDEEIQLLGEKLSQTWGYGYTEDETTEVYRSACLHDQSWPELERRVTEFIGFIKQKLASVVESNKNKKPEDYEIVIPL